MKVEQQNPDELLRHNLVLFVDLLGQSTRLRELTRLPENQAEMDATIGNLRETVGRVRGFRKGFNSFLESFEQSAGILDRLPPQVVDRARQMRQSKVRMRGVSDSVIIDVSLAGEDNGVTAINGVYGTMVAIAGTFPEILSVGVPLRAGIDVGIGIDVEVGELYGPALERAYRLESKQAQWPRISVGDELIRYLDQMSQREVSSIEGRYAATMASGCRELICRDTDGTHIVDYLGPGMASIGMAARPEAVQGVRDFANRMFAQLSTDSKLRERYERLAAYVESRGFKDAVG